MRRPRTGVFVAAVAVVVGLGACSSGDTSTSEADLREEIASHLVDTTSLDAEAAECFAALVVEEVGAENIDDVDFSAEAPTDELQDEYAGAGQKALDECDIDPESLGG